jgi:hypothetical protein
MAAFDPVVPALGTYNDTEQGFEPVVPGLSSFVEQDANGGNGGNGAGAAGSDTGALSVCLDLKI